MRRSLYSHVLQDGKADEVRSLCREHAGLAKVNMSTLLYFLVRAIPTDIGVCMLLGVKCVVTGESVTVCTYTNSSCVRCHLYVDLATTLT